ncbi:hypothetical protein BC937DRAFT_89552 [Endogone sp. FLAS-F59071]|nr:hypothetical protein BC937DRAFT_89552 [Endogone sp. FLAS-F59071]|eukprot:RUS17739.1 hypothetical protein BC937DRAFT_89552 [Endogone sp. FLAS-F59071]
MTKSRRRICSCLIVALVACCMVLSTGSAQSLTSFASSIATATPSSITASTIPTPVESLPINLPIIPANSAKLVPLNIGIVLPDPSLLDPNDTDTHCLVGGGIAAIQMAAMEINNQSLIPGVYVNITYGLYNWKVSFSHLLLWSSMKIKNILYILLFDQLSVLALAELQR